MIKVTQWCKSNGLNKTINEVATEEEAIDKAYDYMIEGYSPEFETEEIDEEEYCGA